MTIWQWFISLLSSVIQFIYSIVNSHGWSIVLFTILIKVLLLPLDIKSRRSMRRMSELNPKIQALSKKYANDKEKLQQKQAELYKKEKINPLAGCLPMLLSMPVLFAMFAVMRNIANAQLATLLLNLQNALEGLTEQDQIQAALQALVQNNALQFEPWLWIKNLWMADSPFTSVLPIAQGDLMSLPVIEGVITREQLDALQLFVSSDIYQTMVLPFFNAVRIPGATLNFLIFRLDIFRNPNGYFILPILAAVSQFFSASLTPQQDSGNDASKSSSQMMKYFFPLFSLWICSTSNAAFSLYWVVSNLIQMAQQVGLNKYFEMQDRNKPSVTKEAEK